MMKGMFKYVCLLCLAFWSLPSEAGFAYPKNNDDVIGEIIVLTSNAHDSKQSLMKLMIYLRLN